MPTRTLTKAEGAKLDMNRLTTRSSNALRLFGLAWDGRLW
jgi:hypothetical protein